MRVSCTEKLRDSNGKIIKYKLVGFRGMTKIVNAEELKTAMRNKEVAVSNLTLTSDNRLVDKKGTTNIPVVFDVNGEIQKEVVNKHNYSELDTLIDSIIRQSLERDIPIKEIPTECGNICYLISKTDIEHMLLIPNSVTHLNKDHTPSSWTFTKHIKHLRGEIKVIGCTGLIDAAAMFANCEAQKIDMFNTDTSKVKNMKAMFLDCNAQDINLARLNTQNVENMFAMFMRCRAHTIDFSNFKTSKVTTMYAMFFCCHTTRIKLNSFDTHNVTEMGSLFNGCVTNELDISSFNTSKVTRMPDMFANSKIPVINLSSFDMTNIDDMSGIFYACTARGIILPNSKLKTCANKGMMFTKCNAKLKTNNLVFLKEYHLNRK